jgi:drug/metabolite transporter (DMT)-like permease
MSLKTAVAAWHALPAVLRGVLWAALSGLLFTILNAMMRRLVVGPDALPPMVTGFWRYGFGALAVTPWLLTVGRAAWHTSQPFNHVVRSFIHATGFAVWFYALPLIPIAETTALGFTTPLFITIGAALFLGEKVGIRRVGAVIIGFVGTLIIIRPGFVTLSEGSLLMLATAPLFAASNLMAKAIAGRDSITAIVGWQSAVITACLLAPALYSWQWPTLGQFMLLALGGVMGTTAHLCLSQSYRVADITATQPIGFLQLVWATMLGFLMFGDHPDLWTWIGAAVIFIANMYISHREVVRRGKPDLTGGVPPAPQ